jgi:hypothetical protein
MYTVQVRQYNPDSDLFYFDTNEFSAADRKEFIGKISQSLNFFPTTASRRYQNDLGYHVFEFSWSGFNSVQQAQEYFLAIAQSDSDERVRQRTYDIEHNIFGHVYILDNNSKVVKTISDCVTGVCARWDNERCDENLGCGLAPVAKKYLAQIPIRSVTN